MALTLAQRFGTNATIDVTTPSSPKLVISLTDLKPSPDGDLTGAEGIDDVSVINNTNKDEYSDKLFTALFLLSKQNQPAEDNDETVGVYISPPFGLNKTFVTRNNVTQQQHFYTINFYTPDNTPGLDADDVI